MDDERDYGEDYSAPDVYSVTASIHLQEIMLVNANSAEEAEEIAADRLRRTIESDCLEYIQTTDVEIAKYGGERNPLYACG